MAEATPHGSSVTLGRLRSTEDVSRITWRDGAPFHDWVIAWGDPESADRGGSMEVVYRVHRVVLVGGPRPAHFFAGALRQGAESRGTDLSKLLPDVCRPAFEKALDFMYGASTSAIAAAEAPLLYKIADVLQCPSLRNHVLDEVARMSSAASADADAAASEVLVGAAALGLGELSDALVQGASAQALWQAVMHLSREAPAQLAAVVPAVMDRIGCGFAAAWGGVEHEGGAVRYEGSVVRFTGGGTCIAWTQGEVRSGKHRWRIRIDEVHNASGFIALGVVAGPKDNSVVGDMDSWQHWYLYYSDDGKKRIKGESDLQDYGNPYSPSDVISIIIDLDNRSLEFALNERSCGRAYSDLAPGNYRVGAELGNSASDMQITLLSYDCLSCGPIPRSGALGAGLETCFLGAGPVALGHTPPGVGLASEGPMAGPTPASSAGPPPGSLALSEGPAQPPGVSAVAGDPF